MGLLESGLRGGFMLATKKCSFSTSSQGPSFCRSLKSIDLGSCQALHSTCGRDACIRGVGGSVGLTERIGK